MQLFKDYVKWANKLTTLYMFFGIQIGFVMKAIVDVNYKSLGTSFVFACILYLFIVITKLREEK